MNPLVKVDVSVYFKVSNSETLGGKGSTGYASLVTEGEIIELTESFVQKQLEKVAKELNVRREDVKLISKEEFDESTAEDEDKDPVEIRERYIGG